jgi:hypothetical protein
MSAVAEQVEVEEPVFDSKAFMEARNKGVPAVVTEPEKPTPGKPEPVATVKAEEPEQPRMSRSMSRLQRAIGREQAMREQLQAELDTLRGSTRHAAPAEDAEPDRSDYGTDAEYLRATQKWDRQQEAKQQGQLAENAKDQESRAAYLQAMDEKAVADIALIPDWDEVAQNAKDDEDAPEFDPTQQKIFMALLSNSDVRAFALHHFAKHPNKLQEMLDLKPAEQIRAFHRLEGRLEKAYDKPEAAQATPEKGKTASTPQKPEGRAEPQQEVKPAKPKPSAEVAARGGSPAPDEPAIGSVAWMQKRNQAQFGR